MTDFVTALQAIWVLEFPYSDTISFSLGQLVIFTTVLSLGISYYRRLRG
jgi:hypothetical protein